MASARPKGLSRKTGINLVPIVIYVTAAVVLAAGIYVWDSRHRSAQEAARRPPDPQVVARNLVENIIGAGTVKEVKIDAEKKAVAVTFEATQFKPGKPKSELRELLEAEAILAVQAVLQQMREYGQVTATLVHQGKTLVVGEATREAEKPTMTFVDERLKD